MQAFNRKASLQKEAIQHTAQSASSKRAAADTVRHKEVFEVLLEERIATQVRTLRYIPLHPTKHLAAP